MCYCWNLHYLYVFVKYLSAKQHFLAVSDDLGVLHVLEICQALSDPLMNEVGKNFYSSL